MDVLTLLANLHGTDKGDSTGPRHNYTPTYHQMLHHSREMVRGVLEVGVQSGASLKMWRDYFPHAEVYGVEIEERDYELGERIHVILGDVKTVALPDLKFDLIVDDGSHQDADILSAFSRLWPRLNDGGFYIIEDLDGTVSPPIGARTIQYFKDRIRGVDLGEHLRSIEFFDHIIVLRREGSPVAA